MIFIVKVMVLWLTEGWEAEGVREAGRGSEEGWEGGDGGLLWVIGGG